MNRTSIIDLKRLAAKQEREKFERDFAWHWEQLGTARDGVCLIGQARIIPDRQYRFDFAHAESKVAVELDGGLYANGGHSRGAAIEESYAKCNAAARIGWCVLKYGTKRLDREMHLIVSEVLEVIRERMATHEE